MQQAHTSPLLALRFEMATLGISAFLQPVNDEYLGEYPAPHARRLQWLSGFSGSAGLGVVCADKAALLVDGRYTLQAPNEADMSQWQVHNSAQMRPEQWLEKNIPQGQVVAVDGWLHSAASIRRLHKALQEVGLVLQLLDHNPIDTIWQERPVREYSLPFALGIEFSGQKSDKKLMQLRLKMREKKLDGMWLSNAESLNWLLNVRGFDVDTTPVWHAMAYVPVVGEVLVFSPTLGCKVPTDVPHTLHAMHDISAQMRAVIGKNVGWDASTTPAILEEMLEEAGVVLHEFSDPTILPRACKNAVELAGIRAAHIRDGKALARFIAELKSETANGQFPTELEVCDRVLAYRRQNEHFLIPSFDTIAGFGPNGAIVHYRPSSSSSLRLAAGSLLLLDSGGQYKDGTTDVTRTIAIGTPTDEMRDRFTRVLKGHIALATAHFPRGTTGAQLDALARQPLWDVGLDYDHGTGHGVGHCLNVHEGPHGISKRAGAVALEEGMVVSNEPGYYKAGEYGIRIENLVVVVPSQTHENFLCFETLTRVPLDEDLINRSLLTEKEIAWLDDYQAWCQNNG